MKVSLPEFDQGMFREKDGQRFFLRLWPAPAFLVEGPKGVWTDVESPGDDFNLTAICEVRNEFAQRYRPKHPELVDSILKNSDSVSSDDLSFELQYLLTLQQRIEERERFLSVIPSDLLQLVRRFPEEHFRLLQLFATHADAVQLAQSNPMLAFLLATNRIWRGTPEGASAEVLASVLRCKRANILKWLGFPRADDSLVRLTGKVDPWACRVELVAGLRETLRDAQARERLRHLRRINPGCMAIAADWALFGRVSSRMLHEVAENRAEDRQPCTAVSLRTLLNLERGNRLSDCPAVFTTRAKLYDALGSAAAYLDLEQLQPLGLTFPAPLCDTRDIQALTTPEDVFKEAEEQQNCVSTLIPQLAAGKLALYRVLSPERATLSLRRHGKSWLLGELEAADNTPVSRETGEQVKRWLGVRVNQAPQCRLHYHSGCGPRCGPC